MKPYIFIHNMDRDLLFYGCGDFQFLGGFGEGDTFRPSL